MENIFWAPPSDKQLAAWKGKRKLEDFKEPHQFVWEENWEIVGWFRTMTTQIIHNGYGFTHLDYNVAYREFDDMGLTGTQREDWKRKLRVLEAAALYELNPKGA